MPPGVRLLRWNLKPPPVAIETCAVVTDPALFARTALGQLRVAMAEPVRWVGWTIPQLIDRLAQVGVVVELEPAPERIDEKTMKTEPSPIGERLVTIWEATGVLRLHPRSVLEYVRRGELRRAAHRRTLEGPDCWTLRESTGP